MNTAEALAWVIALVSTFVSILVTFVVLVFAVLAYRNPETRALLRRQSLIMLLTVLVMSVFFSIANFIGCVTIKHPSLCGASVVVTLFASNFQHFVIMLIAVNLQLTVVHGFSTGGFTIYYLTGSFIASLATILPGAVTHVFGPDPVLKVCWINTSDPKQRALWLVGTAHFWTLLSAAVALCSTVAVLVKLMVTSRRVRKTFPDSGPNRDALTKQNILTSVALRILPHPVFLVISNVMIVALDLDVSLNYQHDPDVREIILSIFYAAPPLFFALVVLFFDHSFSIAVRKLFGKQPTILGVTYTDLHGSYGHPIELHTMPSQTFPSSISLGQSESEVKHDTQMGPSSKPTLCNSDSVENAVNLTAPPDPLHTSGRRQRVRTIPRTTGTVSALHTQSHTTAMRIDCMDLDTL